MFAARSVFDPSICNHANQFLPRCVFSAIPDSVPAATKSG